MKLGFTNDAIYQYALGAPSAVGGAERQQWLLARALVKAGWSVTVGISEGLETGLRDIVSGVEFVGIGPGHGHVFSAWCRFLINERPAWWYWRCASHLLGPAVAMAKLLRVRTIFAAALDPDVNPRLALFHRRSCWPLYAWGLSWVDRILVQHGTQLTGLASHLRQKSFLVPSIAGESTLVKPHSERRKYVAWVGQFKQVKRPDLLVELARKLPDIQFVVCGGPSTFMSPANYSQQLVDALQTLPNVDYRGQVGSDDALRIMAEAAVLLSTADEEGFPNTFLQAWLSGTPVVTVKTDPGQIIAQKKLGIVSTGLIDASLQIKTLLDSPQQRDEIAKRASGYVIKYHDEAAVTALFNHAVLQEVRSPLV